jgi:hypothetical protein
MPATVVLGTAVLCVAAALVMIPLDIHPMFAVCPLLVGSASALAVLVTVRRVCRSLLTSLAFGFGVGSVVGMAMTAVCLVLLTVCGWTDGGHGGIVYLALLCFGAIASAIFMMLGAYAATRVD